MQEIQTVNYEEVKEEDKFTYTYSAREQEEVKRIRAKYMPSEEDKMAQIRRLDRSVYKKGTAVSIAVGTIGALIMGTGMSLCMVWADTMMLPGIVVGITGMIPVVLAYPLYRCITKRERERIAPEILRLTDEIMK